MLPLGRSRNLAIALAAVLLAGAVSGATALFHASAPGEPLSPVDSAAEMVQLLQGEESILWTTLSGPVLSYRVEGWPTTINGNELGGGVVIERPADATAGVIMTERPQSILFEIGD